MKKAKKVVALALCAVMLVVGSVAGTMAYLTSQDTVRNTFTVGNVVITLDEAPVDTNGEATTGERVKANAYKLLPGHEYDKDPTVHVDADSEDCYLFVTVENLIAQIEDSSNNIAAQMNTKGWEVVDANAGIYVYADDNNNPRKVSAGDNVPVFEKIKVAGTVDNTELAEYAGKTINVTAYAVQADGFDGKTAQEIWSAAFGTTQGE